MERGPAARTFPGPWNRPSCSPRSGTFPRPSASCSGSSSSRRTASSRGTSAARSPSPSRGVAANDASSPNAMTLFCTLARPGCGVVLRVVGRTRPSVRRRHSLSAALDPGRLRRRARAPEVHGVAPRWHARLLGRQRRPRRGLLGVRLSRGARPSTTGLAAAARRAWRSRERSCRGRVRLLPRDAAAGRRGPLLTTVSPTHRSRLTERLDEASRRDFIYLVSVLSLFGKGLLVPRAGRDRHADLRPFAPLRRRPSACAEPPSRPKAARSSRGGAASLSSSGTARWARTTSWS